jgi:hypothetical protein
MAPLNVTPIKIAEALYHIIQDPERKNLIMELCKEYGAGKVDKDDLMELITQVAKSDEMNKALQILIPGYDEMCGSSSPPTPAPAPAPVTAAPDISDAEDKASVPKLKKGFLTGGKPSAPKAAPVDAEVAAPKAAAETPEAAAEARAPVPMPKSTKAPPSMDEAAVDPHRFRTHYYQHMHERMPHMKQSNAEHMMHNNFIMHDADQAGAAGNVTIGEGGRAKVLTDEELGGAAEGYTWGQNENEVTLKVKVPKGTKGKDVEFRATSIALRVAVGGRVIVDGKLYAPAISDDSTFSLEDDPEAKADGGRLLLVSVAKRDKTGGHSHWPCVVEGAPRIDPSKFGPQVIAVNPDDSHGVIEKMKTLETGNSKKRATQEGEQV